MTKYLTEVIKQYKMDWLRIDYNIDPLGFWQFLDKQDPDRVGMAEIRYIEGLYRMWDDLRATYPHLAIDDCASGGRRIDLETMSRSIPLWRSDNTCDMLDHKPATVVLAALKNQTMTAGLSRYVPFSTCGQMGSSPYLFRSGLNAGISFGEDCRPAGYPREQLKQAIAEAKRLRPYFFGDFYALGPVTVRPRGLVRASVPSAAGAGRHGDGVPPRCLARRGSRRPASRDRPGGRLRSDAGVRLRAIGAEANEGGGASAR